MGMARGFLGVALIFTAILLLYRKNKKPTKRKKIMDPRWVPRVLDRAGYISSTTSISSSTGCFMSQRWYD